MSQLSDKQRQLMLWVGSSLGALLLIYLLLLALGVANPITQLDEPRFNLSDRITTLQVVESDGGYAVELEDQDETELVSGDDFLAEVYQRQQEKEQVNWLYRIFDITSLSGLFWVILGLAGQVMFTGRMIVQWLASEREKKSVVPVAFWWLSLAGSSLLIIYFTWRVDVVGILGQCTGWFIYIRNLWFIYKKPAEEGDAS